MPGPTWVRSGKQERAGSKAIYLADAFFQPFEFPAIVGPETVLNVIREPLLMQCGTATPANGDAWFRDSVGGQPKIANGEQSVPRIDERQAIAHPRNDPFLLK